VSSIEPEEARALLARDSESPGERVVEARDFRRPRRLSTSARAELERQLGTVLDEAQRELRGQLGADTELELASLGEIDATTLFEAEAEAPCVLSFRAGGAEGWLFLERAAAVGAVERLLGSDSGEPQARALSELETGVLIELFAPLVRRVAKALKAECTDFEVRQALLELRAAAARAAAKDAHRLELELAFERGARASTLRLCLPGLAAPSDAAPATRSTESALGARAQAVPVALRARLAGCQVPLSQLLALEPGDIIPLEDRVGQPLVVLVGNKHYGSARLGTHRGRLAIRIERIDTEQRS
jgi:flagellar motor switch protein FliM